MMNYSNSFIRYVTSVMRYCIIFAVRLIPLTVNLSVERSVRSGISNE